MSQKYVQNAFPAGAPPRTPLGEPGAHYAPPDPLVGWGGDTPPQTPPHSASSALAVRASSLFTTFRRPCGCPSVLENPGNCSISVLKFKFHGGKYRPIGGSTCPIPLSLSTGLWQAADDIGHCPVVGPRQSFCCPATQTSSTLTSRSSIGELQTSLSSRTKSAW